MRKTTLIHFAASFILLVLTGCINDSSKTPAKSGMAELTNTGTGSARGSVTFTKTDAGVHVVGSFQGLPPGVHGFHVHEKGSCDSAGVAAGGHFNPMAIAHGLPDSTVHHMGDLGNLTAGTDSLASIDVVFPYLTLDSVNTIVGHALIIHALPDLGTQPTGAAGGRIACAVIMSGM